MESNELQQVFFQHIKSKIPPNLSLVDEVAEILGISNDSSYRRIRGEKIISFEEISRLASHFKLSVDQVLNLRSSDTTVFSGNFITVEDFDFTKWLQQMHRDLQFIASFKNKQLIINCKDIFVFHHLAFPEVASFKNFAWMKTLIRYPQFNHVPFSFEHLQSPLLDIGLKAARLYTQIPGIEIMNIENIHTTLNQIEYYKVTRGFRSPEDLKLIYEKLHDMINHIEAQAEAGLKFMPGEKPNSQSAEYNLYVHDFTIGDHSSIAIVENTKISFVLHNIINYMTTRDERYTEYHYNFLQNIMKKSVLLSKSGEKLRSGFFYLIHEAIDMSRDNKMKTFGNI